MVTALLVAVALCYRLKAYDINSRDNFYYLEQAMDEIYAGVGTDSMKMLNKAYDETIEVLVYFDAQSKSYITMKNDEANDLMKETFIKLVKNQPEYQSDTILAHLQSFISNQYDEVNNKEGIQISVGNVAAVGNDSLTIFNLVLKREADYSTVNTRKGGPAQEHFVQSITTDLAITKPEFDVNFNTISSDLADLYDYCIIADMGTVISGASSAVKITGNLYAASDFYNKDYNITDSGKANYITKTTDEDKLKYAAVNSYDKNKLKKCNGLYTDSMYSGLYIDGAIVDIVSDRIVVPGTIAAMNSSIVSITNADQTKAAEIWADGIVLGGYSLANPNDKNKALGSSLDMRANAYIADDLELNAKASVFKCNGEYCGYNYASLDNRTYVEDCVTANGGRTFSEDTKETIKDGATIKGQAHYNSSAIIVNGEDSNLDLSNISSLYIAGQSYIELSKQTTTHNKVGKVDENGNPVVDGEGNAEVEDFTVTNHDDEVEVTSYDTYDYAEKTAKEDDYYTTTDNKTKTNIQDYRTGEAISIKSNQLAYLAPVPNSWITDNDKGIFLSINKKFYNDTELFKNYWDDIAKIPLIKSVISGKTYYFFDFSEAKSNPDPTDPNYKAPGMNEFIAAYADLFEPDPVTGLSKGEKYGLTDITDYDHFKIEMLNVKTDDAEETDGPDKGKKLTTSVYSNSAITIKDGTSFTIKSRSSSIAPLTKVANRINANIIEQNTGVGNGETGQSEITMSDSPATLAQNITIKLQSQYKEVKWLLSSRSKNQEAINEAHAMEESDITPINHFFDFSILDGLNGTSNVISLTSKYKVWLSKEDVHITKNDLENGSTGLQGLIVCKGDVIIDSDIKSFEGLIVAGGKVFIDHSMSVTRNPEIVKSILRECDESQQYVAADKNHFNVCELFVLYTSIFNVQGDTNDAETESMKTISAIQFEDILGFENWKKNVD